MFNAQEKRRWLKCVQRTRKEEMAEMCSTHKKKRKHRLLRWPGALPVGVLFSVILSAHSHSVNANECIGKILKIETGKIRISQPDGKSVRIDSSDITMPLCVLDVVAERPQYKIYIPDGKWKGEWLLKRRKVMEIDGSLRVDCIPSVVATVKIKDTNLGGTRASGEEPCN